MGIKISNAVSIPAIIYNKIFMNSLKIVQAKEINDKTLPKYSLVLEFGIYGTDEENIRHFLPKTRIISIDDYLSVATEKAKLGDMDLIIAMQAIEKAIATILEDQENLGTATVVSN